jgi:TP901 family phage tail tape measure protein
MTVEQSLNAQVGLDVRPLRAGIQQAQNLTAGFGQQLQNNLAASAARAAAALGGATRATQGLGNAANTTGNQIQNGLTAKLNTAQSALGKFGSAATSAGRSLSLTLTAPLVALGTAAVKVESDFEASLNMLQGATGASAAQMAVLSQKAKELGADLTLPGTSAADAASAMLNLSRAGLNMREVFDASLPTLQLSAATHVENQKAAEILAVTLREFGLAGKDAAHAADLLTAAGNRTVGGVTALYEGLRKAGPTLHDLNVPLNDTVTALALLNAGGLKGAEAGTVLRGIFAKLADPTNKMKAAMQAVGLTFFDSSGKMKSLADISEMLKTKLGGLTDRQRAMVEHILGGNRAMAGLSILAREGAAGFDSMAKKIGVAGEASRQATAQMKGIPGAIEAIKSGFETAAQGAIEPFSKDLAALGRRIGELLTAFASLPPQTRRMWVEIAAGAALLGPVLIGLGQFAFALKNLIGVFQLVRTGLGLVTAALGGPVTLAITAIIAVVALLAVAWIRDWGHIQEKTRAFLTTIQQMWDDFAGPFKSAWETFTGGLKTFWEDKWGEIKPIAEGVLTGIKAGLEAQFPGISTAWSEFCDGIAKTWSDTWKGVEDFSKTHTGKSLGQNIAEWVIGPVNGFGAVLNSDRFKQNLANEEAKSSAQKAFGTTTPGMGDLHGYEFKTGPKVTPANPLGAGGGHTDPAAAVKHHIAALDAIGEAHKKLTPLQRQSLELDRELAAERVHHRELLAGEGNIAAQVAGKFNLLHDKRVAELITLREGDKAYEKQQERLKAFRDALNGVYADIKDVRAFDPTTKLMNRIGPLTPKQQDLYRGAIATRDKEKADTKAEEDRIQAQKDAYKSVSDTVDEYRRTLLAAHAADKFGPVNRESLALLSEFKAHYADLNAAQQKLIDGVYDYKLWEEAVKAQNKALEFNARGWAMIRQRTDEANQKFAELRGTSSETAISVRMLADSIDFMDLEMVDAAFDMLELDKRNRDLAKAQDEARKVAEAQKQAFEDLFAEIQRHQELIRNVEVDYQKLTHGSLKDIIALNSEWRVSYEKLGPEAKRTVDGIVAGIKKIREETKKQDFIKQFAQGFQSVFEQAFNNLHQGFKSFFSSIITGVEQMLQQIAAKFLAAQLTEALFGKADENGNQTGGVLGSLIAGAFGGGGGGGGGDISPSIFGLAGGGLVAQDTPYLVGERGPELFTPSRSGRITPNAQLAGAGGPIHITMNIATPDAGSFRRSQHQISQDATRAIREASRRSGR